LNKAIRQKPNCDFYVVHLVHGLVIFLNGTFNLVFITPRLPTPGSEMPLANIKKGNNDYANDLWKEGKLHAAESTNTRLLFSANKIDDTIFGRQNLQGGFRRK
jgi:hypothetical protein